MKGNCEGTAREKAEAGFLVSALGVSMGTAVGFLVSTFFLVFLAFLDSEQADTIIFISLSRCGASFLKRGCYSLGQG